MNFIGLKRKKIVFVFGNLELGGAERQGFLLAQFLQDECGAIVEIWGLSKDAGTLSKMCDEAGIVWRAVRFSWRMRHRPLSLLNLTYQLHKVKVDVLMPYTSLPNVICSLIWRLTPAKVCIWNQEDEGLLLTKSLLHRVAIKLTPLFISNSTGGMTFLRQMYNMEGKEGIVIRNGIRLAPPRDDRQSWRKRLGISEQTLVACMVANIHPYKDHATLLRAWKEVVDVTSREEYTPVLLLAGRVDSGREALLDLATELGINNSIRLLGKVDDVPGLLKAVDLCVHSSISEGIPNSILEAMASGVAVAGTDIPGIREAVGPDGVPFLAPVKDALGLAKSILTLLENSDLRADLECRQKARVEKEFLLSQMCEKSASFILQGCR